MHNLRHRFYKKSMGHKGQWDGHLHERFDADDVNPKYLCGDGASWSLCRHAGHGWNGPAVCEGVPWAGRGCSTWGGPEHNQGEAERLATSRRAHGQWVQYWAGSAGNGPVPGDLLEIKRKGGDGASLAGLGVSASCPLCCSVLVYVVPLFMLFSIQQNLLCLILCPSQSLLAMGVQVPECSVSMEALRNSARNGVYHNPMAISQVLPALQQRSYLHVKTQGCSKEDGMSQSHQRFYILGHITYGCLRFSTYLLIAMIVFLIVAVGFSCRQSGAGIQTSGWGIRWCHGICAGGGSQFRGPPCLKLHWHSKGIHSP